MKVTAEFRDLIYAALEETRPSSPWTNYILGPTMLLEAASGPWWTRAMCVASAVIVTSLTGWVHLRAMKQWRLNVARVDDAFNRIEVRTYEARERREWN